MTRLIHISSLLFFVFMAEPVFAQADTNSRSSKPLPRVLVIGDSVYSQHTRELGKVLKDKAQVVYAMWNPDEIADSTTTIALLDRHLGRIDRNGKPMSEKDWPTWDLIHFNCGLGDLIHRAPGMKQFRVLPIHVGGVRNTPQAQYVKNLDTLVKALKTKTPNSRLVWGSTTPIRASSSKVFEKGSEIKGIDDAEAGGAVVFHAGTKTDGEKILANGGRVLNVTALAPGVAKAKAKAYDAVAKIDWPEGFCRGDIGWRAIDR